MDFKTIIFKTNNSAEEFAPQELKELYHMHWDIETSFRELKYAIGLASFYAKNGIHYSRSICKTYDV